MSSRVKVVTDSAACIPNSLLQEYGIRVVPLTLVLDGRVLRDGVDITAWEFYHRLQASDSRPTTSQPSVDEFLRVYRELACDATDIVSIHVPRELSGTIDTARLAASAVPQVPIRVIDARTATIAEGFIVLAAARAAETGASLDDVVKAAQHATERVDFFACVSLVTVASVHRGGRSGEAAALLDAPVNITPILRLRNGRVTIAGLARNRQRAIGRMLELVERKAAKQPVRLAIFHADDLEEAEQIAQHLLPRLNAIEFHITEFTPVMGAHTGPGVIGVAFHVDDAGGVRR